MISISVLALSSLFAQAENPQPQQKVIIKREHVITDADKQHDADVEVEGKVKIISIINGEKTVQEYDLNDMPEGFDVDIQHMGGEGIDSLPPHVLEMIEGQLGDIEIDLDDMHGNIEVDIRHMGAESLDDLPAHIREMIEHENFDGSENSFQFEILDSECGDEQDCKDEQDCGFDEIYTGRGNGHGGMWMMDMDQMGRGMPHMMDMRDMGQMMFMMSPQMGQMRNMQRHGNMRGMRNMPNMRDFGGLHQMHQMHQSRENHGDRRNNHNDVAEEMHHRLDELEGRLDNIEAVLHELLERR